MAGREIPQHDSREQLAEAERRVQKLRMEVEGQENFGVYDEMVGPLPEGESRYSDYAAAREEVYKRQYDARGEARALREGDRYRDMSNGQFASRPDEYNADKYYGEQMEEAVAGEKSYEDMTLQELAQKWGEYEALDDRSTVAEILSVLDGKMQEKAEQFGWSKETMDLHYATLADIADRVSKSSGVETLGDNLPEEVKDKLMSLRGTLERAREDGDTIQEFLAANELLVLINSLNISDEQKQLLIDGLKLDDSGGESAVENSNESDQENNETSPEQDDESTEAENDAELEESSEVDDGLELAVGDRVTYKDRDGNVVEGKIINIIELDNEDYKIYNIETDDGRAVFVSYADIITAPVAGAAPGEQDNESKTHNYPELYAQLKNLFSGDKAKERLRLEGEKVASIMAGSVLSNLDEFRELNPDASAEQIQQQAMALYLDAEKALQKDIIEHIDGVRVDGQEVSGSKGALRRFGAWMDRHGGKIKAGLLIAGAAGLAVTGIGLAAGASLGIAAGAGTAIGAIKGAAIGVTLQRHGSKESAARGIDSLQDEEAQAILAKLDPENRETFELYSRHLIDQFNTAADKDHSTNVKRTAVGGALGTAIGAIAGSLQISTPTSHTETNTTYVPNSAPEVVSHTIAPGELSGQVLDNLFAENNINLAQVLQEKNITGYGDKFTLPDGSTNVPLIHAVERTLGPDFGVIGQTHSFAGADALSNEGIRSIFEAIRSNVNWGSQAVSTTAVVNGSEVNWPWTVWTAGSASLIGDGVAKITGDVVGRRR